MEEGEECDEGADMPSDSCVDCVVPDVTPVCGNGVMEEGEACDEGANMPSDTCVDCAVPDIPPPVCGDRNVDADEECDDGANGDDTDGCRDDCTIPVCGDGIVDMGEECDNGTGGASEECREDCTLPVCGDGVVDMGEECDMGAENGQMTGAGACKADCTLCVCGAEATYVPETGGVTIDFDMCGSEPLESDFVGIYPCNETTKIADQDWWDNKVCRQFPAACGEFQFGYEEGKVYVGSLYKWFSWTCGSPLDGGCQTKNTTVWPDSGTVVLDPTKEGTVWAFLGGRTLEPGCYKAVLQREMYFISPPPYPDVCPEGWAGAMEFTVPASSGSSVSPLEQQSEQSGSSSILSTVFVSLVLMVSVYFVSK